MFSHFFVFGLPTRLHPTNFCMAAKEVFNFLKNSSADFENAHCKT